MPRNSSEDTLEAENERQSGLPQKTEEDEQHDGNNGDSYEQDQHQESSGARCDEEKNGLDLPPLPVGLLDPSLRHVFKEVAVKWAATVLILFSFILCILSLYWAVLFHVNENMSALTVAVVNFDARVAPYNNSALSAAPSVGQTVERFAQGQAMIHSGVLGYTVQDADIMYHGDPMAVRQAVYDYKVWAAIIVNTNASTILQEAVRIGNTSYDPLGAGQMIINSARDETTYYNYILPQLYQFQTDVAAIFGPEWIRSVLSNSSLDAATYGRAPQALNPAIGFSMFDLRPFNPPQATPAVTIGLIYLIIIAFFSFSFFLPVYTKFLIPKGHPPLHFYQLIMFRLLATTTAYLFMSLAYSLVSLAFQIPFSNTYPHNDLTTANNPDAYGKATFVVYWMLNWVGMYALGLASENVTMIIGQPWTALWLIFWVITNVSTSFYAIPLSPGFFKFGYAWPLYHIVNGSRTLLFDTHSRIGLNFGVLFAWCAVNTLLFPPCCVFMRWKTNKELARRVPRRTIKYLVDG
ncbi:hypothetical protein ABEF92_001314 [Exophiala dermatitidis]|uniref:DUF3533 domain-containing protein n=1 Tax=Exophiala dermatitidis (strain ATCC 34100 / CBS 525.76 / NIH/UT8656) TaxID=858893 RepID=H6C979_EXODN|nr:uncharacterized protein HMPREF1120_08607 [Exophiala dermatitidis NIH/UT8656]EHY60656.1 hypothetical protein HMPREF1120_08607 [Exophiala dermatitidis NIH/UT8656]